VETIERTTIVRVTSGAAESVEDAVATEQECSIVVDGRTLVRAACSPGDRRAWVLGYLLSEGRILGPSDIDEIRDDGATLTVRLARAAAVSPPASVASDFRLEISGVLEVVVEVTGRARLFAATGGAHAMAIASATEIIALAEDVSRTCALEKAIGRALEGNADFGRSLAVLSSRVPERMIAKLARCGIPIVAAVSAPTAQAVHRAAELNVCLCGFVRGERMNVYAHGWRVGL